MVLARRKTSSPSNVELDEVIDDARTLIMPPVRAIILEGADGGSASARALRRRGVPVTMISKGWVTRARGIDGRRATKRDEWLAELNDVASLGDAVLIPASDPAVEFVSRDRDLIPATSIADGSGVSPGAKSCCPANASVRWIMSWNLPPGSTRSLRCVAKYSSQYQNFSI